MVIIKSKSVEEVSLYPTYRVILFNDDINDFMHVLNSVEYVFRLSREEAFRITMNAHCFWSAVCQGKLSMEVAEHRAQQLKSFGLGATFERDG